MGAAGFGGGTDVTNQHADDRSIAELVKGLSQQSSELARKEVELAKAEMSLKAKRLGIGAGAFGAAGLVGLLALGALTATMILALAGAWAGAGPARPDPTRVKRSASRNPALDHSGIDALAQTRVLLHVTRIFASRPKR
jgi:hypothetical protein